MAIISRPLNGHAYASVASVCLSVRRRL